MEPVDAPLSEPGPTYSLGRGETLRLYINTGPDESSTQGSTEDAMMGCVSSKDQDKRPNGGSTNKVKMKIKAIEESNKQSVLSDGGKQKASTADDAIKVLLGQKQGSPLTSSQSSLQDNQVSSGPGNYRLRSSHNLPYGMSNSQPAPPWKSLPRRSRNQGAKKTPARKSLDDALKKIADSRQRLAKLVKVKPTKDGGNQADTEHESASKDHGPVIALSPVKADKDLEKKNEPSPGTDDRRTSNLTWTRRSRTPENKESEEADKPPSRPKPKGPTTAPPSAAEELRASKIIVTPTQNGSVSSVSSDTADKQTENVADNKAKEQAPPVDKSVLSQIQIVTSSTVIPNEVPRKEITPPPAVPSTPPATSKSAAEVKSTASVPKPSLNQSEVSTPTKPPRTLPPLLKTPTQSDKKSTSPPSTPVEQPPPPPLTSPPPLTPKSPNNNVLDVSSPKQDTEVELKETTEVQITRTPSNKDQEGNSQEVKAGDVRKEISTFSLSFNAESETKTEAKSAPINIPEQNGDAATSDADSDYSTPPTERKNMTSLITDIPTSERTQLTSQDSTLQASTTSQQDTKETNLTVSEPSVVKTAEETMSETTNSTTVTSSPTKDLSIKITETTREDRTNPVVRPKERPLRLSSTEPLSSHTSHYSNTTTPDGVPFMDSGFGDDGTGFSYVTNDYDMDAIFGRVSSPQEEPLWSPGMTAPSMDYSQDDGYLSSPRGHHQPGSFPEPDPRISQLLGTTNHSGYSAEHIRAKLRENHASSQAPISAEIIRNRLKESREPQGIGQIPRGGEYSAATMWTAETQSAGTSNVSVDDTLRRLEMVKKLRRRLSSSGPPDESADGADEEDAVIAERYAKTEEKIQQEIEKAKQRAVQQEMLRMDRTLGTLGIQDSHTSEHTEGQGSPREGDPDSTDVRAEHYYGGSRNANIEQTATELNYFKHKQNQADNMCNAKIDRLLSGIGQRYRDHQTDVMNSYLSKSSKNLHSLLNQNVRSSRTPERETSRMRRTQSSDRYRYREDDKPKFYARNPFDTIDV